MIISHSTSRAISWLPVYLPPANREQVITCISIYYIWHAENKKNPDFCYAPMFHGDATFPYVKRVICAHSDPGSPPVNLSTIAIFAAIAEKNTIIEKHAIFVRLACISST